MSDSTVVLIQKNKTGWFNFIKPARIVLCRRINDVCRSIDIVEKWVDKGGYAAGYISYDAAPAFDHAMPAKRTKYPLLWFGLFNDAEFIELKPTSGHPVRFNRWEPDVDRNEYYQAIERIKNCLVSGDSYQVNYTFRLKSLIQSPAMALFKRISAAQDSSHSAFIETPAFAVCSASPELFFELKGRKITARPMKGTSDRGMTLEDDRNKAKELRQSQKNQAENIMIVDMIRNDLGRIAVPGSVRVSSAFDIEKYPTLLQMTSTIEAKTDASLKDIFRALFPCASVTGAPKINTMRIIDELEKTPRGIYCGAIGYICPGRKAKFNVAIRTVYIDKKTQTAEYGVGSGIVIDSDSRSEYDECIQKTEVLTREQPVFELLETVLWTGSKYYLLNRHMKRLCGSAEYFDYKYDSPKVIAGLRKAASKMGRCAYRVRLLLNKSGKVSIQREPFLAKQSVFRMTFADKPVSSKDVFLYHKSTNRTVYDELKKAKPEFDDVILWNERGEVTETTIANIVVVIKGRHYTPPVSSGLLAGTYRQYLIEKGKISEKVLTKKDVISASRIYLVNSVRKEIPVSLSKPV